MFFKFESARKPRALNVGLLICSRYLWHLNIPKYSVVNKSKNEFKRITVLKKCFSATFFDLRIMAKNFCSCIAKHVLGHAALVFIDYMIYFLKICFDLRTQ